MLTPNTGPAWGDIRAQRLWTHDRRRSESQDTRQALVRLRLAEFVAADHLPPELMQELTAAIDGVVAIVRGRT